MSSENPRRNFLRQSLLALSSGMVLPLSSFSESLKKITSPNKTSMNPIITIKPLGFQWETSDPFLFCVHHEDAFPKGNAEMGPDTSFLKGRHMGDDFIIKDGFRMYHSKSVPGFPGHPHRGFETITVVRKGIVDHADSMGAAGRYGNGDVQWMTAGKGVQHSEMFPLINADKDNEMELFQIWLNLPKRNKMVEPHFKMFWKDEIPNYTHHDKANKSTVIEIIAGEINQLKSQNPPPNSWAADANNEVAVWNIKMQANATFTIPKTAKGINRTIYFYEGSDITVAGTKIDKYHAIQLISDIDVEVLAGASSTSILMLQGRPIGEPVMQYGPFVMNTKQEINEAFEDYHATQFGGWPWPKYDQVHARELTRFAKYADGKIEKKEI